MKKKLIGLFLALCLIISLLPVTTLAESATSTKVQVNGEITLEFTTTAKYAVTSDTGVISGTTVTDEAVDPWNIKYQMVDGATVNIENTGYGRGFKTGSMIIKNNSEVSLTGTQSYTSMIEASAVTLHHGRERQR